MMHEIDLQAWVLDKVTRWQTWPTYESPVWRMALKKSMGVPQHNPNGGARSMAWEKRRGERRF